MSELPDTPGAALGGSPSNEGISESAGGDTGGTAPEAVPISESGYVKDLFRDFLIIVFVGIVIVLLFFKALGIGQ